MSTNTQRYVVCTSKVEKKMEEMMSLFHFLGLIHESLQKIDNQNLHQKIRRQILLHQKQPFVICRQILLHQKQPFVIHRQILLAGRHKYRQQIIVKVQVQFKLSTHTVLRKPCQLLLDCISKTYLQVSPVHRILKLCYS